MYSSSTRLCLLAYFDVARPPVQVHVQVLDGAKLAKHVLQVLLGRFLVHIGDNDDPAFDGAHGCCARLGARVAGLGVGGRGLQLLGLVNVHFRVGHGCGWDWRGICVVGGNGIGRARWAVCCG
tara:strand:- start:10211 stop:10579 length:369 start_codon:yes stop_codon:yes gene_type:complete